jgi:D-threo-aldose 1-dehydrogenase
MASVDILLVHDIGAYTHGERHEHYWRQLSEGGFKALDELRSAGAVRAVGLGVNEAAAIQNAMHEFDLDCALLAGRYTLIEQATLDALLPECERRHVSLLIGGAFNSGILAHGVRGGAARMHGDGASTSDLKFNYGEAPPEIVERVAGLEAICDQHGVALPSAALQFPYAHPVVASVLTGARNESEVRQNVGAFTEAIPGAFWDALRAAGLLHPGAPTPGA